MHHMSEWNECGETKVGALYVMYLVAAVLTCLLICSHSSGLDLDYYWAAYSSRVVVMEQS